MTTLFLIAAALMLAAVFIARDPRCRHCGRPMRAWQIVRHWNTYHSEAHR